MGSIRCLCKTLAQVICHCKVNLRLTLGPSIFENALPYVASQKGILNTNPISALGRILVWRGMGPLFPEGAHVLFVLFRYTHGVSMPYLAMVPVGIFSVRVLSFKLM